MKLIVLLLAVISLNLGCQGAIEDFVDVVDDVADLPSTITEEIEDEAPTVVTDDIKTHISAGKTNADSTNAGVVMRIKNSRLEASSTSVGAHIGMQQDKVARP